MRVCDECSVVSARWCGWWDAGYVSPCYPLAARGVAARGWSWEFLYKLCRLNVSEVLDVDTSVSRGVRESCRVPRPAAWGLSGAVDT